MEENTVEETPATVAVEEQPKADAKKRTRTKKVAEENKDLIVDSSVEEASETVSDEGQKVITGPPKNKPARVSNMKSNDDGIVGSRAADRSLAKEKTEEVKPKAKDKEDEKVAVWSKGNIRWTGVGYLSKGYNIVTKEAAEKWLTREGIREATAEEVATYYGK